MCMFASINEISRDIYHKQNGVSALKIVQSEIIKVLTSLLRYFKAFK